jgi:myxalamid-type polyketide synthase MxaE and MxaD
VQAVIERDGLASPHLWLVTENAQPVSDGIDDCGLAQAPLLGFAKVVAREHPEIRCACIDLGAADDAGAAEKLLAEMHDAEDEEFVALRGSRRHVARLVRRPEVREQHDLPVRSDSTYLITGGLGDLGLHTAKWLVERGARSLVLLSRRGASPEIASMLAQLRVGGVSVDALSCDVAKVDDLASVLAKIESERAPLRGVIHAAGIVEDSTIAQETLQRFSRVLAPKMRGAWNLHVLTANKPLDFFVLYSSMASMLGAKGQANYAAANAFLDALTHYRRARGQPAIGVNWGPWSEIGRAARQGLETRMAAQGLGMITPAAATAVLDHLLRGQSAQVGVAPMDWKTVLKERAGDRALPFFSIFSAEATPVLERPDLRSMLRTMSPEERSQQISAIISAEIAKVLRLPPAEVELHRPLNRIGLDSLMAIELRNRLRGQLALDVPLVTFMQGLSVAQLAAQLGARLAEESLANGFGTRVNSGSVSAEHATIALADVVPLLDRMDELDELEVDRLLGAAVSGRLTIQ